MTEEGKGCNRRVLRSAKMNFNVALGCFWQDIEVLSVFVLSVQSNQ